MSKQNKQKIKKCYKKSIWPSALLFIIFLGSCVGLVSLFVTAFQGFLIDEKIADIQEDAANLGRMVEFRMQKNNLFDAVSSLEEYMQEENDICITDENYHILQSFRNNVPDFKRVENITIFESYRVVPELDPMQANGEQKLLITYRELFKRSWNALEHSNFEDPRWLEEPLFHTNYWVEVPTRLQGYRLYYRDSVTCFVFHSWQSIFLLRSKK